MSNAKSEISSEPSRHTIGLRIAAKGDFLERFLADVGIGGYHLGGQPIALGTPVRLEIGFIGYNQAFSLDGNVVWRHAVPPMKPELPPGVGIEFEEASEATLRALLTFVTLDDDDDALKANDDRQESRVRVQLPCEFLHEDQIVQATAKDISGAGLYIESPHVLTEGERFIFFLDDENYLRPLVMEGRVVWTNTSGQPKGFGVELLFDSRKHKTDVQSYIASLSEALDEDA